MNQPAFIKQLGSNKWYNGHHAYDLSNVPLGGIIVDVDNDGELYAMRKSLRHLYGIDGDAEALAQFEEIKGELK